MVSRALSLFMTDTRRSIFPHVSLSLSFSRCSHFFQPIQSSSAAEEGQVSDQDAQEGAGQHVTGPVDIEVEPEKGDERRQGDGGIAEAPVRLRQDRGGDGGRFRHRKRLCHTARRRPRREIPAR